MGQYENPRQNIANDSNKPITGSLPKDARVEAKKEFNKEFVLKVLNKNFSSSTLITNDCRPTETLKNLIRCLIPNIKEENITSLGKINGILQDIFFKQHAGKFRHEIKTENDQTVSFQGSILSGLYQKLMTPQTFKNLDFKADTALILGITIGDYCSRFSFLLQEANNNYPIKKLGILGGNRILSKPEIDYFEKCGFKSESEIKTEYDLMEAIAKSRENVKKMLELQNLTPESVNKCLNTYDNIKEMVYVNTVHPNNKPDTYGTVFDYIKLGSNIENEKIVVVSSQPLNDYQHLTALNAFLKAGKIPQELGCIGSTFVRDFFGPMPETRNVVGDHFAKLLYTILDILKGIDVNIE